MQQISSFFFFNDTATTEIYTLSHTTLFRSVLVDFRASSPLNSIRPSSPRTSSCVACGSNCRSHSMRSEEHTSELQSQSNLVCRLLLEKKNQQEPRLSHQCTRPSTPHNTAQQ